MKTNDQLIEKFKIKATGNEITLISTEAITKQIIATLITNPDYFENIWVGREEIEENTITIDLNFKADLDKFLSVNDFRNVLSKYFDSF